MHVMQCPRCEVRFASASELNDHLSKDHPKFHSSAISVEDDLLGACHCNHRGGSGHPRHDVREKNDALTTTSVVRGLPA